MTEQIGVPIIGVMDIIKTLSTLQALGLTQSEIASAIGCSQPTISDMTSGKAGTTRPSFKIISGLQKLAKKHKINARSPDIEANVKKQH